MSQSFRENRTHGTPLFPLQVYSHRDKNGFYFVSSHWHEEIEFIYTQEGVLNCMVKGRPITLKKGEFLLVNSGELHEIKSTGASFHHAVVFHPSLLNFSLYDACQHNFIQPVTTQKLLLSTDTCALLPEKSKEDIIRLLLSIVDNYQHPQKAALLTIKIALLQILEILFRNDAFMENTQSPQKEENVNKLRTVIDYMKNHYDTAISLETLSSLAYMTPTYFCRYFRQETGKTPITFLNEYRIQKAAELLSSQDISISQAALVCGFDNFSYFIRKFKEYKGMTPGKYRHTIKK